MIRFMLVLAYLLGMLFVTYGCAHAPHTQGYGANTHWCGARDPSVPPGALWRDGSPYQGEFVDCDTLRDGQAI